MFLKEKAAVQLFKLFSLATISLLMFFPSTVTANPEISIIEIRQPEGVPGTKVVIVGEGATPNGTVVALFEAFEVLSNITVGWTIAYKDGSWDIVFAVPVVSLGEHVVYLVDNATQTSDSTVFVVTSAQIRIEGVSPPTGPVGTGVYFSGSGATPNGEVRVYFDEQNVANTTAMDWGWWSASFEVPDVKSGSYIITASDVTSNTTDTATFTVTAPPTIQVSPSEAPIGSKITITGEGFTPNTGIFLSFEDLLLFSPIIIDENGEFNVTLFIPMVNSGNYTIKTTVTYPYQASIANASFTVTFGVDTLLSNQMDAEQTVDNLLSNTTATQQTIDEIQSTTQETLGEATGAKESAEAAKTIADEARIYVLTAMIFAIATTIISTISIIKRK